MALDQFAVIRQTRERGAINIIEGPYSPLNTKVPTQYDAHYCVLFYPSGVQAPMVAFGIAGAFSLAKSLFGPIMN